MLPEPSSPASVLARWWSDLEMGPSCLRKKLLVPVGSLYQHRDGW